MHRCPNCASPDRWFARAMMAGDEDNQAFPVSDRLLKRAIDCSPSAVQAHSVKVDGPVGNDRTAAKFFVPASVERCCGRRLVLNRRLRRGPRNGSHIPQRRRLFIRDIKCLLIVLFAG